VNHRLVLVGVALLASLVVCGMQSGCSKTEQRKTDENKFEQELKILNEQRQKENPTN
jgi:hypothetical protein